MNSYFRRTVGDIASRVPKRYRNIAAAAAVVLAALAGGSVMLTQDATGKITARAVLDVQPKPEAVELEYTPDAVFRPGGLYDLLPPLSHEALVGAQKWPGDPWDTAFSFGYKSPKIVPAPASMSHVSYVANNAAAPWGEPPAHGPLWGARAYNVGGVITDLTISRVGDWSNGREGHGLYLNVHSPLIIRHLWVEQVGANGLQIVSRPAETMVHPMLWEPGVVRLEDIHLIQCGLINTGNAVRAGFPLSYYATGHDVVIDGLEIRTNDPIPFKSNGMTGRRSHGGLLVGPAAVRSTLHPSIPGYTGAYTWAKYTFSWFGGFQPGDSFQTYFSTPHLLVKGLDIDVTDSDREEVHLRFVEHAVLVSPSIVEHGGQADVYIVDDCGTVDIFNAQTDMVVTITSVDDPHRAYGRPTFDVAAGEDFHWRSE